jgi:hypothetical protein
VDNKKIEEDRGEEELEKSLRMVNKNVTMDYGFQALNLNPRKK